MKRKPAPHFLLFSESRSGTRSGRVPRGRWHFLLESVNGDAVVEADDVEPEAAGERLELLAVVRGLEALDQPSRVSLFTPSRYVTRGLRYGLDEWRENRWHWERHGRMVPVKNQDLWRRVDRALRFHEIVCRRWPLNEVAAKSPTVRQRAVQETPERGSVRSAGRSGRIRGGWAAMLSWARAAARGVKGRPAASRTAGGFAAA